MRWKRWTAALLLLLAAASVSASASAVLYSLESRAAVASSATSTHETGRDSDVCPLLPLAEEAATPAVLSSVSVSAVVQPAYVRALVPTGSYRIDPEPPVKPPAA